MGRFFQFEDETVLYAINEIARARFEEALYFKTWDLSFGASYDILLYLQGQFKYVQSIAYVGWDYHWDSYHGTGRLEPAPVIIKHNCMGEYSIIQEARYGKHFDGKIVNYLSRPVYDDMPKANLSDFPLTSQSDYYANYFLFRENGKVIFELMLTVQKISGEGALRIGTRNGVYCFEYDTNELDRIYRKHMAQPGNDL